MRIVIDFQAGQTDGSRYRGIGRYSRSLIKEVARANASEHELYLVLNGAFRETIDDIRNDFDGLIPTSNVVCFTLNNVQSQKGL